MGLPATLETLTAFSLLEQRITLFVGVTLMVLTALAGVVGAWSLTDAAAYLIGAALFLLWTVARAIGLVLQIAMAMLSAVGAVTFDVSHLAGQAVRSAWNTVAEGMLRGEYEAMPPMLDPNFDSAVEDVRSQVQIRPRSA